MGPSNQPDGFCTHSSTRLTLRTRRRAFLAASQFDTLIPTLTVREMLAYTAALKSGRSAPPAARAVAVEALLRELDLTNCGDVMIGDRLRKGVSGGQVRGCLARRPRGPRPRGGPAQLRSPPRRLRARVPSQAAASYSTPDAQARARAPLRHKQQATPH